MKLLKKPASTEHNTTLSQLDHHLFPDKGTLNEQILFVLRYAVRAPSTHNSQPWHFVITDDKVLLFADWSRKLPEGDKDGRDLYISLGACLEHLIITLKYFSMLGEIIKGDVSNPKAAIAEIGVYASKGRDASLVAHIEAIEGRFNARGPFLPKVIPEDVFVKLEGLHEDKVTLNLAIKKEDIQKLAELTAEGMREVHQRKPFRRELSRWMINNYSSRKEGIPGYTMLAPGPVSLILPWVIRTFNMGAVLAKLNTKSIMSAPAIGIISSEHDTPSEWISTGMLFQRTSLLLNAYDIRTSIFVASVEIPHLRKKLTDRFGFTTIPQFTFAFGYPKVILRQSPRHEPKNRIIEEVR